MAYAVLTRDAADVGPYAAALAPLGLEVVAMPVTTIVAPADPGALRRALIAGPFDGVVVTSRRVAAALAEAAGACGVPLPAVWAVGEATRAALAGAGIAARCIVGVRDGAELGRALVAAGPRQRALVPRAEDGREELVATLRAAGWDVAEVIAYRTVAIAATDPARARGAALLATGEAAVCCVFAPSQVAALGGAVSAATGWVAIGETTAAALRAAGAGRVAVADAPTPEGIAKAAGAVYRSEP